jgi:gamma-glutamyltranspeptidase / glutathione hydrolase
LLRVNQAADFQRPSGTNPCCDNVAPVFLRHVHHGLGLQAAIDAPLFTSRHWPSSFYPRACEPGRLVVEERFGEATTGALRRRGHKITVEGPWALGRVCAVGRDGGKLSAAATPRLMQAYAIAR